MIEPPILLPVARLPARGFGTVVVLGAGDDLDLRPFRDQAPKRLVLVEGDPEAGRALEKVLRAHPTFELRSAVVDVAGGTGTWQTCNLRGFAAPSVPDALRDLYPRLRVEPGRAVSVVALSDLLGELKVLREPGMANVLVLDLPGQEAALLHSLEETDWLAFDYVLWRGLAAPGPQRDTVKLPAFVIPIPLAVDDDPLWPLQAARVDARAQQLGAVRGQLAVAAQRADAAAADAGRWREQLDREREHSRRRELEESERAASYVAALATLRAERDQAQEALATAQAAARQELEVLRGERDAARGEAFEGEQALQRLQVTATAVREQMTLREMEESERAASHAAALAALRAERDQAQEALATAQAAARQELEVLRGERDAARGEASERERALHRLQVAASAAGADVEDLRAARDELASQLARTRNEHAALDALHRDTDRLASECADALCSLQAEHASLRTTHVGATTERDAQRRARQQAEARLAALQHDFAEHALRFEALEATVLAQRQDNQTTLKRMQAESDQLGAALKASQSELATIKERQAESATADGAAAAKAAEALQAADKDRQALNRRLLQQTEAAVAADLRADAAEMQLRRLDQEMVRLAERQARVDEELVRAEGQLALVARLSLGEPGI